MTKRRRIGWRDRVNPVPMGRYAFSFDQKQGEDEGADKRMTVLRCDHSLYFIELSGRLMEKVLRRGTWHPFQRAEAFAF